MIEARQKLDRLLAEYSIADAQYRSEQKELMEAEDNLFYAETAQQILQNLSKVIQQQAHQRIASVVSRCLEAVFDEPYEFKIEFECKRGRTEANLLFVREGMTVDPISAAGGGVIDIASFGLRLACLVLTRPPLRRILILDEPFRFVSKEFRPRVRVLLEALSREMGVQIVLVTHSEDFVMGTVVEVG